MNKSTIVTTNMPFSRWGEVFSDNTLASAVLDRLLHYSHKLINQAALLTNHL